MLPLTAQTIGTHIRNYKNHGEDVYIYPYEIYFNGVALPVGCVARVVASDDSFYESYIFYESYYDWIFGHDREGNSN